VPNSFDQTIDLQSRLSRACVVQVIVGVSAFAATVALLTLALAHLNSI
jgi:precorrin-2 methylase